MEIANTNDENSFDPIPRLKSSPIPIKFISFNWQDDNCIYCGEKYICALFASQKYCEKCLSRYINDITDNNIYLDVHYDTMDLECSEHKISRTKIPQSIQECCGNCVRILCFKQIDGLISNFCLDKYDLTLYDKVIESEKNCKLCGKSIYREINELNELYIKLCSDCYLISSELIESTSIKKQISILYLPWWHNGSWCNICGSKLTFTSDCQKYFFVSSSILQSIFKERKQAKQNDKWIPYSQFKNVKEMTRGGYGIIYNATWSSKDKTVILKRFENSKNDGKYFLNELKSYYHCFKDKKGGDLHKHLQKDFARIKWDSEKLRILHQISAGLETIHNKKFIHRDFHSGNILFDQQHKKTLNDDWKIGDLGLSQAVNSESSNNEVYGVIPYIAPEIFRGSIFSKEADIYSLGMIMWELTTGCKPFDNVEHDHHLIYKILDGERPKITEDTPECYANLMKKWTFKKVNDEEFRQGEAKRAKLIESKKIGPEFAEKRHLGAIYTSRPLSALISKCSSIYSFPKISFDKRDSNYTSELENNTDIESLSSQNLNSAIQKFPTALNSRYSSAELELDINTESLSLYDLNSTIQNYSTALDSRYNSTELEFDINTESLSLYDLNSTIQNYSTALDSRYVSAELDLDINTESSTLQNYSTALDFRYISTELELDIKTERYLI
ncbi:unnamed protein product [Rhizophagus irregularis]|nr:unnamed protein product [Rhizophagus irregularis]